MSPSIELGNGITVSLNADGGAPSEQGEVFLVIDFSALSHTIGLRNAEDEATQVAYAIREKIAATGLITEEEITISDAEHDAKYNKHSLDIAIPTQNSSEGEQLVKAARQAIEEVNREIGEKTKKMESYAAFRQREAIRTALDNFKGITITSDTIPLLADAIAAQLKNPTTQRG